MKKILPLILIHLLSLFLILRLIGLTVTDRLDKSKNLKSLKLASQLMPGKAVHYYHMGLLEHYNLINYDIHSTIRYYEAAIKRNPLYKEVWFDLANAYQSINRKEEAFMAIENFYKLNRNNPERVWDTGIFFMVNDSRPENSFKFFRRYIKLNPYSQEKVYKVINHMNIPVDTIISDILSEDVGLYNEYLRYLIREDMLDSALQFRGKVKHEYIDDSTMIRLCSSLISKSRYREAWALWDEIRGAGNVQVDNLDFSILSNGSFEDPVRNGCFDWVIGRISGIKTSVNNKIRSEGSRSFGIIFDGKYNLNVRVIRQVVPVEPDTGYFLKGRIKTEELTTTNGLFFEVYGHNCKGLYRRTESVTGTTDWKTLGLSFNTPGECKAIVVSLGREKSEKFNNKIGGMAWIDGIELIKSKIVD